MTYNKGINVNILEKTGSIRILIFIYQNSDREQGVSLSEVIRGVVASSDTIQKTVDYLISNGLIKDEYTKVHPYKRILTLTALGLEIAKPLADIEHALRSQGAPKLPDSP